MRFSSRHRFVVADCQFHGSGRRIQWQCHSARHILLHIQACNCTLELTEFRSEVSIAVMSWTVVKRWTAAVPEPARTAVGPSFVAEPSFVAGPSSERCPSSWLGRRSGWEFPQLVVRPEVLAPRTFLAWGSRTILFPSASRRPHRRRTACRWIESWHSCRPSEFQREQPAAGTLRNR